MFKTTYKILTENEKKFFIILLFLILLNAVFETIGIVAIIPLISLIIQDEFLTKYKYLTDFLLGLSQIVQPNIFYENNNIKENLVIGGTVGFVIVFLFKTIFFIFLTYVRTTFANNINYSISKKLYKGYLGLNYIFHTIRNSTNLKQNILNETSGCTATINSFLIIITESFILLSVIAFLLVYNFSISISVFGFLTIISYAIFMMTKRKSISWGSTRLFFMEKRFKVLEEGLDSVREIYIFRKSQYFINNFSKYLKNFLKANRNFVVTQSVVKPIFELLGVTSVMFLLLVLLFQGNDISKLIATIGLFLAASFRLLPSLNKIVNEMQQLKFNKASLNRISKELEIIDNNYKIPVSKNYLNFEKNINVNKVTFFYPNNDKPALKNVSFTVEKGSKFGIKGNSGSGKTTLINLILTLTKPSEGEIKVDGVNLETNNLSWLKNIGYVSQDINLIDDTIEKNIAFGLSEEQIDQQKLVKAIDTSQLKLFVNDLAKGVKTRIGEKGLMISGGQRQRIGIARALYNDPSIIILDESTNSLDLKTEKFIMDTIYNLGKDKTIVIISHRDSALNRCDKIISISDGKIEKENIFNVQ